VGVVVEDYGNRVMVSIGDDAPGANPLTDERHMDTLAGNARLLLDAPEIAVGWACEEGVNLLTLTVHAA
jgi:hypothetical protein